MGYSTRFLKILAQAFQSSGASWVVQQLLAVNITVHRTIWQDNLKYRMQIIRIWWHRVNSEECYNVYLCCQERIFHLCYNYISYISRWIQEENNYIACCVHIYCICLGMAEYYTDSTFLNVVPFVPSFLAMDFCVFCFPVFLTNVCSL